jgi:hypothetical protein
MKKLSALSFVLLLMALPVASCGDGGGEKDTAVEDLVADDGQGDGEVTPDTPVDPLPDDGPGDTPGEDVPEDQPEDTSVDGRMHCEVEGGYCTTYPVIPDAVVVCEDREGVHYWPAPPADRAMGCTVEGEGAGPWCCLPHDVPNPSDCEDAGGECYPDAGGGEEDTCPMGWVFIRSACDVEDTRCCSAENG